MAKSQYYRSSIGGIVNIDRMNLENEIEPEITHHRLKVISSIIAWLPGLADEDLMKIFTTVQYKTEKNVTPEIFSKYLAEQREVEAGSLTAPAFLQAMIENSIKASLTRINELEDAYSGMSEFCDKLNEQVENLTKEKENQQAKVDKLTIQVLACMQILELCCEKESSLTHVERNALARVGKEILNKLFPDGIKTTKRPIYEDF